MKTAQPGSADGSAPGAAHSGVKFALLLAMGPLLAGVLVAFAGDVSAFLNLDAQKTERAALIFGLIVSSSITAYLVLDRKRRKSVS